MADSTVRRPSVYPLGHPLNASTKTTKKARAEAEANAKAPGLPITEGDVTGEEKSGSK